MRDRLAFAVTLVICAGFGLVFYLRPVPEPLDVVRDSVAAAQAGDVRSYLRCFGGPMRESLKATVRELGEQGLRESLQARAQQFTGFALSPPRTVQDDPLEVVVQVDFVYRDRNEVQDYRLRRRGRRWQIIAVGRAATAEMPVPYGTPVAPVQPETDAARGDQPAPESGAGPGAGSTNTERPAGR